jgi:hypothetical protein
MYAGVAGKTTDFLHVQDLAVLCATIVVIPMNAVIVETLIAFSTGIILELKDHLSLLLLLPVGGEPVCVK